MSKLDCSSIESLLIASKLEIVNNSIIDLTEDNLSSIESYNKVNCNEFNNEVNYKIREVDNELSNIRDDTETVYQFVNQFTCELSTFSIALTEVINHYNEYVKEYREEVINVKNILSCNMSTKQYNLFYDLIENTLHDYLKDNNNEYSILLNKVNDCYVSCSSIDNECFNFFSNYPALYNAGLSTTEEVVNDINIRIELLQFAFNSLREIYTALQDTL